MTCLIYGPLDNNDYDWLVPTALFKLCYCYSLLPRSILSQKSSLLNNWNWAAIRVSVEENKWTGLGMYQQGLLIWAPSKPSNAATNHPSEPFYLLERICCDCWPNIQNELKRSQAYLKPSRTSTMELFC